MKLALIGFGNAGGKIVDECVRYEAEAGRSSITSAIVVNSARVDLERLEYIPQEDRFLIGQTDERVKGHGVGSDPDLGSEIARMDQYEIDRALDRVSLYEIDAFLVVAGLGGGTGSGGAPVLASEINQRFETPVYGLGVLPSASEGGRASLNAARSLPSFTEATENLLLFDNDAWRASDDSVKAGYDRTNREIAKRFMTLLSAGEIDGSTLSENAMDSSDIRRTLATGGVSTVAFAETAVEPDSSGGLLDRFRSNAANSENVDLATKVNGVIRQAVRSRLTCPAEIGSTERSLIIVSGPPSSFSRKGLETGRRWVERQTESVEVLAGDDPRSDADSLAAVVLLSNVTNVPRVDELQEQAVRAQDSITEQRSTRETEISELISDEDNRLDPV